MNDRPFCERASESARNNADGCWYDSYEKYFNTVIKSCTVKKYPSGSMIVKTLLDINIVQKGYIYIAGRMCNMPTNTEKEQYKTMMHALATKIKELGGKI